MEVAGDPCVTTLASAAARLVDDCYDNCYVGEDHGSYSNRAFPLRDSPRKTVISPGARIIAFFIERLVLLISK